MHDSACYVCEERVIQKIALEFNQNAAIDYIRSAQNCIHAEYAIENHKFHFQAADWEQS